MKFVEVEFENNYRRYSYKCAIDTIEIGNVVVVQANSFYSVGRIVKVSNVPSKLATRWVVQRVDIEFIENLRKKEERKEEIKALLDRKLKAKIETNKYDILADDEEAIVLLKELSDL